MTDQIHFDSLDLPISNYISNYPIELQREVYDYLNSLTEIERNAYKIAFHHLESSFNIVRSNGFKSWKLKKDST